jgi:hypothetical protein
MSSNSMPRKALKRAGARVALARSSVLLHIPPLLTSIVAQHTFRYQANAPSNLQSVTKAQLLNNLIVNLTGSTTNAALIKSMKINKIRVWSSGAVASSAQTSATVILEWISTAGPNIYQTDSTVGTANMAVLDSPSPKRSLASFWFDSGVNESDVMFFISCPPGAFIDVHVSMTTGNDTNARLPTTAASGTAGIAYYTYLDGPRTSAIFAPIGFQSLN